MKTQKQYFREAQHKNAEANELFLEFVRNGMTRDDLLKNIERRPSLWQRFYVWLEKLPKKEEL